MGAGPKSGARRSGVNVLAPVEGSHAAVKLGLELSELGGADSLVLFEEAQGFSIQHVWAFASFFDRASSCYGARKEEGMKMSTRAAFAGAAISIVLCVLTLAAPTQARAADVVPDQYIVVFHDTVPRPQDAAQDLSHRHGLGLLHVYEHAIKGFAARIPAVALSAIARDPRVQFISEDRVVMAFGQTLSTGVNRIEADLSSAQSGNGTGSVTGVAVAIIDTGIDKNHPDLNVKGGYNCQTGSKSNYSDGNGHGTHVAGTVGAKDNTSGVVGVAPGVPLYAVRVLNDAGYGSWSNVICGIDWVTANAATYNIKVANMSLGGGGSDDGNCGKTNKDALHKAICNSVGAGITYVVAAGNSAANFNTFVPAAYNEVLTVTAMADFDGQPGAEVLTPCDNDQDDSAADFSNYTTAGSPDESHTIAAPGVCIFSTWNRGGYNTISGTSMASPHVAGTAALCIAKGACAGMTPELIIARLREDAKARSNDSTVSPYYGFRSDPNNRYPSAPLYFGYLVYAGGY